VTGKGLLINGYTAIQLASMYQAYLQQLILLAEKRPNSVLFYASELGA